MIFIIGGNGLVGSSIVSHLKENNIEYQIIQKENKTEFFGKHCNTLIYANGNAFKYKANSEPFFDFNASVSSIAEYIHKIKFENFIHRASFKIYYFTNMYCN